MHKLPTAYCHASCTMRSVAVPRHAARLLAHQCHRNPLDDVQRACGYLGREVGVLLSLVGAVERTVVVVVPVDRFGGDMDVGSR